MSLTELTVETWPSSSASGCRSRPALPCSPARRARASHWSSTRWRWRWAHAPPPTRCDQGPMRRGSKRYSRVTAVEDDPLADVLAAGEGMAIIRREVGADGRSVCASTPQRDGGRPRHAGRAAGRDPRPARAAAPAGRRPAAGPAGSFRGARWPRAGGGAAYRAWRGTVAQAAEMLTDHTSWRAGWAAAPPGRRDRGRSGAAWRGRGPGAAAASATHAEAIARAADAAIRALRDESAGLDALAAARAELAQAAALDERFAAPAERASRWRLKPSSWRATWPTWVSGWTSTRPPVRQPRSG